MKRKQSIETQLRRAVAQEMHGIIHPNIQTEPPETIDRRKLRGAERTESQVRKALSQIVNLGARAKAIKQWQKERKK